METIAYVLALHKRKVRNSCHFLQKDIAISYKIYLQAVKA